MVLYMVVPFLLFAAIIVVGVWLAFSVTDQGLPSGSAPLVKEITYDNSSIPKLIDAHLEMIGGRESLEQVRSVRFEGRLVAGTKLFDYIGLMLLPDKGMLVQTPRGSDEQGRQLMANGGTAWQVIYRQDGSRIPVPLKEETQKMLIWSLRVHNPFRSLALQGVDEGWDLKETIFMGERCYELTRTKPDGSTFEAVLDKETLYVLRTVENLDLGEGMKEYTLLYDDHRVVSGIVEPFHTRFYKNRVLNNEAYVSSYLVNPGLVSWLFVIPEEIRQATNP